MTTAKKTKIRFFTILIITLIYLAFAFLGRHFAPFDPLEVDPTNSLVKPNGTYLFGTDKLGRDIYSRILCGARDSFALSFLMVFIVTVIGTVIGMVCGYAGGMLDVVMMRIVDILLAFPDTVFCIAIAGMLGPGVFNAILAISMLGWTSFARMSRSLTSSLKNSSYVTQAKFNGASKVKILFRYIFPNILPQIVVMSTMKVGGTMLTLASLSFLGLASKPPTPEWGVMVSEAKTYMQSAPWMMIYPGIALLITVILFNLLGDSLRDLLDIKKQ